MMGIKSRGIRPFFSMFLAILFAIGFAWIGVWGIIITPGIIGGAWIVLMSQTAKPIVACPVCDKDLGI
jgi:quinol-cytochrome oxidoreductase complex cytochrome b subunit